MNVFRALSHPQVAGDDGDDIGWVPTPYGIARHAMRRRPSVGDDDDYGDDGEDFGDDGDGMDVGAQGRHLGKHITKLDKKIARKRAKGKDTSRLQAHRARKAGKLAHKLAKHGGSGAEAAAMAGGYPSNYVQGPPFTGRGIPESLANYVERSAAAGQEVPLSLLIADPLGALAAAETQLFPFAIAKTLTTLPIVAQSAGIAYAAFQVVGVQCQLQCARGQNAAGFPNQDILLAAVLSSYNVAGFANMLFQPVNIDAAGISGGAAGSAQKIITSLRSNEVVDKQNTIQATGTLTNAIANVVAFNCTLSITALCRTIYDPASAILPPR